jgi:hypothetical protein
VLSSREILKERAQPKPVLVLILAVGALVIVAGLAWHWASTSHRTSLSDLGPDDRQRLVEEALTEAPAVFQPAWVEPRVGYTLRPRGRISAWNDSFVANALGYRTHPPAKPQRTFRVLFLGDSWTYGMGVRWRESFPMQLEKLANGRRPPGSPKIQAWSLALPGYNTLNELAALELFFDRLRPDAVVLCPTPNDIDSSNAVTPTGMLARSREPVDDFGDPHSHRFLLPLVDAPSFERRWRLAFASAARTERLLRQRGIPFFVYFAATWEDSLAHSLMEESGIQAPYAITPAELTVGAWRNPPPFRHGTPQANRRYAGYVYALLAEPLGWPPLGEGAVSDRAAIESARVFRSPPTPSALPARNRAARKASEELPESFEPGRTADFQCLAAMDCETGRAPKASTFLLRRRPGSSRIALTLSRLPAPTWLYPQSVEVRIADDAEVVRATVAIPADGPSDLRVLVRSPRGTSAAIEVTLLADRASASPTVLAAYSFFVRRIEQR